MPNLSRRSAQSQTDAAHNLTVLHACFMLKYSKRIIKVIDTLKF